jgi:hypothetical protein
VTVADAPDTVTEAVALLRSEGYTEDVELTGGGFTCPACGEAHRLEQGFVERLYRFEGPSDPGDEAIVLGVRCGSCERRGVLTSAFGPDADPAVFAHLLNLTPPPGVEPGSG